MTTEQQRIAIAEAHLNVSINPESGLTDEDGRWYWADFDEPTEMRVYPLDYLNDLNPMREAVMAKGFMHNPTYEENLAAVCNAGDASTYWWEDTAYRGALINATAAQRAEAFLRTIGKWEGA